jgi:hypothetical protein
LNTKLFLQIFFFTAGWDIRLPSKFLTILTKFPKNKISSRFFLNFYYIKDVSFFRPPSMKDFCSFFVGLLRFFLRLLRFF